MANDTSINKLKRTSYFYSSVNGDEMCIAQHMSHEEGQPESGETFVMYDSNKEMAKTTESKKLVSGRLTSLQANNTDHPPSFQSTEHLQIP